MGTVVESGLAQLLSTSPPFDALGEDAVAELAGAATVVEVAAGRVIIDTFLAPTDCVYVVISGAADLWNNLDRIGGRPDEHLVRGGVFGFSAVLTDRSVGPRAIAVGNTTLARIPGSVVKPAFSSPDGARFLADHLAVANRRAGETPSYGVVDELIVHTPYLVARDTPAEEVARAMSERGVCYAAVQLPDQTFGLVTDTVLREGVLAKGRPASTPVGEFMAVPASTVPLGTSSAEAMIALLDAPTDLVLVVDRAGALRGAVAPLDFMISPTTSGVSVREQIRRAGSVDELVTRAGRLPSMVADLLDRGLASGKVIAVHSATVDEVVRRALTLVFAGHPELPIDGFTWLALGSNGRREAVLSSDLDAAVAFDNAVDADQQQAYRTVFAEVDDVLRRAGLPIDLHGTTPHTGRFSRTNADWRAAANDWLAAPELDDGAIMTSLLVDGRPIHGDPGLPEVVQVFGALRRHPGTMRLLLKESLARRAKMRSVRDLLSWRTGPFDIKAHALLPVVNIARFAALAAGSAELATTERLRAASGSAMLPDEQADTLIEVFETLQRLRLRHQLAQRRRGEAPSDVLAMDHVSPIDRSIIGQAVREISSVQRRMDNMSAYASPDTWGPSGG